MYGMYVHRPFERTSAENEQIYKAVKKGSPLGGQVTARILKELCVMAQLDHWREEDTTGLCMFSTYSMLPDFFPREYRS